MPNLKCTKKLLKAFGKSADKIFSKEICEDTSILGGWSANLVRYARMRFVLFINEKTLLTVYIHLPPQKEYLLGIFEQALLKELKRLGVPENAAAAEAARCRSFTLGESPDRSMRGYLKQMAFDYEVLLDMQRGTKEFLDIEEAQALANETPHIRREHDFPDQYVRELFGGGKGNATMH